ncbi:hypothetical protein NQ314_007490 [Rhamnusium bicolor]|uniref:Large ribosomal subunit protein bL19m n=1 Tax=Rhamnusium bicolor TaxID=1586634 RepID=A0AAV8YM49_9CUCU|nr:hypothetical protein NQ314_007490 [Rhamnusium bicolor]
MFSIVPRKYVSRLPNSCKVLKRLSSSISSSESVTNRKTENLKRDILQYRHIYPEFLPDPKFEFRNIIREKLERNDMIARRTQIDIPEFYVGSIMAVSSSDPHTPGKFHRFVGICIQRGGCGLRAHFTLRNVIDHQPRPWLERWERKNLQGVQDLGLPEKFYKRAQELAKPWEKYDLMKEYMQVFILLLFVVVITRTIPEEEQTEIFSEIQSKLQKLEVTRKQLKKKRVFVKPIKLA